MCISQVTARSIFENAFVSLESKDVENTVLLRHAFENVERQYPEFQHKFLLQLLNRLKLDEFVSEPELRLRLAFLETGPTHDINCDCELSPFSHESLKLKEALIRLPDTIDDRLKFVESIRFTAVLLKQFLEAANSATHLIGREEEFKVQLRELMQYFRKFSKELKAFFSSADKLAVFDCAYLLVHQINAMLTTCHRD